MSKLLVFIFTVSFSDALLSSVLSSRTYTRADFPAGFVFGSGTSAYQVEGAAKEDGRSPSIWDAFADTGHMHGATGDIACDQYHKYKEDVQLMVETGLEAYRFSISWSRLIPNGTGFINPKGLQYYNNLIDELVSNGIQPHVTLHHHDIPLVLEDRYGGWLSRQVVKDFVAYAEVCFREFGDRVLHWTTVNEVNVFALGGYDVGLTPPGRCSVPFGINCTKGNSTVEGYLVVHHILLAHASAVELYKEKFKKQEGLIGLNLFSYYFAPLTNSVQDAVATQRVNDFYIGWILSPLVFGTYPESVKKNAGSRLPSFTIQEVKLIRGSFDFIGLNYYKKAHIKDNPDLLKKNERDLVADMAADIIYRTGDEASFEYPVQPDSLQRLLEYFKQHYENPPIYIHENGQRTRRESSLDDSSRVELMEGYIGSLLDPIRNGSDIRGYFSWSFLDLFEMLDGYESSYGLYYIDLNDPELKRQAKLSAKWYANFLKQGRENTSINGALELLGREHGKLVT
ncbi:hypothetical protein QQ045_029004 [Rhodiola kirilowii]